MGRWSGWLWCIWYNTAMQPSLVLFDTAACLQYLRARGYRITAQRAVVIAAMLAHTDHISAEDLYGQVRTDAPAINLATVYRTLELLYREGVVQRADLGGECIMYSSQHHGAHLHLVCRQCGSVATAHTARLAAVQYDLHQQYGFYPDLTHLSVPGLCAACAHPAPDQ